ncbi:MAG TPA: hypothetical protein PKM43_19790 [Verrucomicrobiota bacterium]|nr:hypothetical protein [Verrucomicrobiota bacterium]HRZ38624.1 hypothetical protein [Candidatus Paceibacterota bacterium]
MTRLGHDNRRVVATRPPGHRPGPSSTQPALPGPYRVSILDTRRSGLLFVLAFLCGALHARGGESAVLYRNDFTQAEIGTLPDGMLALNGKFAVREEAGNRFLELPGTPLDTYGVLFGPAGREDGAGSRGSDQSAEIDNLSVTARIHGTNTGRRYPAFAVGLGGVSGYRLQVSPGKRKLELSRGDADQVSVPFEWTPGGWLWLKLEVRKTNTAEWTIRGKVWKEGTTAPSSWTITRTDTAAPKPGRSSIWGSPFADTPIRFDDVSVERIP